jgi:hypothetical protein
LCSGKENCRVGAYKGSLPYGTHAPAVPCSEFDLSTHRVVVELEWGEMLYGFQDFNVVVHRFIDRIVDDVAYYGVGVEPRLHIVFGELVADFGNDVSGLLTNHHGDGL